MFKGLTVENFKGFPDKTKIEFEKGMTLILGRNGAGKSSILYGVKFALFGNDKKEGVPRPNYDGKRVSVAELDFIGKDGNQYQITYSYKPRGRSNRSELYRLDPVANQYVEISPEELPGIFPYDLSLFNSVFFVEEGDLYKFITAKKDIWGKLSEHLSQLLQLDRLDALYSGLKATKKHYSDMAKTLSRELKSLKEENIEDKIKATREELEEVENDLSNSDQIDIDSIEQLAKTRAQLEHLERKGEKTGKEVKQLRRQFAGRPTEDIPQIFLQKEKVIKRIESELAKFKEELSSKQKMQHLYEGILGLLEHVIGEHEDTCPTCRQPLTLEQAKNSLEQARREAQAFQQTARELKQRINELSRSLQQEKASLEKMKTDYDRLLNSLSRLKSIQEKMKELRTNLEDSPKLASIQEQLNIRKDLEIRKHELTTRLEQLFSQESRMKELPDQINYYKVREILFDHLMKATRTVHEQRLKQHLEPIENHLRDLIRRIKDESWDVSFEESIEPIFRRIGVGDTYLYLDDLSGAEKTLVFLLFRWLLSKQIAGKPFLVMDDAINHLDETNRKLLFTILSEVLHLEAEPDYQLILTSYDPSLEELLKSFNPKVINIPE